MARGWRTNADESAVCPHRDLDECADEIDALRAENARLTERERIVDEWGSAELRGLRSRAEAAEARISAAAERLTMFKRVGSMDHVTVDGLLAILGVSAGAGAALTGDDQAHPGQVDSQ